MKLVFRPPDTRTLVTGDFISLPGNDSFREDLCFTGDVWREILHGDQF